MPLRVLLTGKLHGPDMGASIVLLYRASKGGVVNPDAGFIRLDDRFQILREFDWEALNREVCTTTTTTPSVETTSEPPVASISH